MEGGETGPALDRERVSTDDFLARLAMAEARDMEAGAEVGADASSKEHGTSAEAREDELQAELER